MDKNIVIDATNSTSRARFINHSCRPNSQSVLNGKRIFIEAMRAIAPGTEITYDYDLEIERDTESILIELYECRCGSAACRGTICRRLMRRRTSA
jgi:SET domain-containing protein